jgi:hypothetical protein
MPRGSPPLDPVDPADPRRPLKTRKLPLNSGGTKNNRRLSREIHSAARAVHAGARITGASTARCRRAIGPREKRRNFSR